ncbi:putative ATP-dependent RNA helicase SoYb [Drosophila obscura]|uniref:putative ATP-dependent RNA helicase SoYb n=1 Tax=Drosophila obscura TaxID=7282 RepID=UPI001BB28309|nr:putative ATP-dependent RNA helicase SoYb [Drosophila obscura]
MFNGNDLTPYLRKPEDCQGNRIMITHYVSPQQFWYITAKDIEACSALVRQMELQLVEHCSPGNQRPSYCEYLEVIVRYMLCSLPKLLRGVIRKRKGEEYLVFALDYGFTINCTAKDLWMLPGNLNKKLYDVQMGGVAFIAPYNGSTWTKAALSVFGQKLEEAHMLSLDIRYQGPMNENFGVLWIKSNGQSGPAVDAAVFLEERRHGRRETSCSMPSYLDPLSFDLADINDVELKAGLRATKIIQLVAASAIPLAIEQNRIDCSKAPSKTELRVERNPFRQLSTCNQNYPKRRSPPCPSKDPMKLERLLQLRSEPPIPDAARRLSKVSGSGDTSVQTALIGGSSKKENVEENVERRNQLEVYGKSSNGSLADQMRGLKLTSRPSMSECSPSGYSGLLAGQETININANNQRSEPSEPRNSLLSASSVAQHTLKRILFQGDATAGKVARASSSAARDTVKSILFKEDAPAGKVDGAMPKLFQRINLSLANRVLTHSSKSVSVDVVCNMSEASLGKEIEIALQKLNHQTPLSMQCFAWPHLMKGNSLLLVNASGTGRSWCYLPALCALVMRSMKADGEGFMKKGPLAILLTESSVNANVLSKHCSFLMQSFETQFFKVVNTHDHSEPEVVTMLLGSCGILVATLSNLNALMDYKRKGLALFEPARLKHVVLDDYDRMQQAAPHLLNEVINRLRRLPLPQMQLVLVAQRWHEQAFQKYLTWTSTNLLIFGDFLEAAMYGRVKLTMDVGQSKKKSAQLLQFLASQTPPQKRTIIFCNSQEEMVQLRKVLVAAGHQCVIISKDLAQEPHQLLLVYDESQLQLRERNKELLVHFSLPESWKKFAQRFHVMDDCVQNRLAGPLTQPSSIASHIMLDESNTQYGPSLVRFLKLHGLSTEKLSEQMSCFLPRGENSLPFCLYLLKTGECTQRQCTMRHHFLKADVQHSSNPCQQSEALVRCRPCKIYGPTHMALWPTEYMLKGTTVWVEAPFPASRWIAEVELSVESNPKQHHPVRVSDVCLVHQQGLYKRVRVMDIPAEHSVTVQLMDHGTELMKIRPWDLLKCDAKFIGLPMLAMDVKLSCVEPTTGEASWSPESIKWVHDTFYRLPDGQHIQITVDFSMLDVVYVKEIVLIEECPTLRTSVYRSVLRKELIARKFGKMTTKSLAQGPPAPLTCRGLASIREKDKPQIQNQVTKTHRKEAQVKEALADGKDNGAMEASSSTLEEPKKAQGKGDCQSNPPTVDSTPDRKKVQIKLALADGKDNDTMEASSRTMEDQSKALGKADGQSIAGTVDPTLDGSQRKFLEMLRGELASENSSRYAETRRFLQSIVGGDELDSVPSKETAETISTESGPILCLTDASPGTSVQEPSKDQTIKALQCATTLGGAVAWPMVKWHQTLRQIELIFEQKVPEYELFVRGSFLSYFVAETSPPQRCFMNLLGEVRIASEKLHGYFLHVKLSKVGSLFYWPTLLNSLYTQQHSRWLSYDVERAKEPPSPMGLLLWERHMRQVFTKVDSTTEEDSVEYDSDDSDLSDSALYDL